MAATKTNPPGDITVIRAFSLTASCLTILIVSRAVSGDEGMYPISELARLDLSSKGMQLSDEEIFSADHVALVDGICRVNGCTGSFVSPDGLIITNHHCAYRAIQSLSSANNDYLKHGFAAENRERELHAQGYTVRITESYRDVSQEVLSALNDQMDFGERTKAIEQRQKELEKQAETDNPGRRAEVAEMFQGKTYVLFLYTYIKDVRLVFAPPASVGNFGGDVDNWEWPRHTGDFSFMRAYVGKDGGTADYSPDNVPYQPKRFVQVAPEGADEGDMVFLLGYPGRTARHKTSAFLEYEQQVRLPAVVDWYQWQIRTMDEAGKDDRAIALKMTSRSKSLANTEKRSRGQLKGLKRAPIISARQAEEQELQAFINSDPQRKAEYGHLLEEIAQVYEEMANNFEFRYRLGQMRDAPRAMTIAFRVVDAAHERAKPDLERESPYMDRNFDQTIKRLMLAVRDFHRETDLAICQESRTRLASIVDADSNKSSTLAAAQDLAAMYEGSRIGDQEFVSECFEMSPDELQQVGDPFIDMMLQAYPEFLAQRELSKAREGQLDQLYGDLLEVKRELRQSKFVPDANGTLRLTYGYVRSYSPEDAVIKTPITTLQGVVDKTTGVEPFVTPKKILDMHSARQFGRFAHPKLNDVPVAILYSTDTTGGNSGSPIFNAKGQLVGVNFDRAFEATINDFAWNESYSRSIGVDIRYALWITGEVYEAKHLLSEMGL